MLSPEFIKLAALAVSKVCRKYPNIFSDVYNNLTRGSIRFKALSGLSGGAISANGTIYLNEQLFTVKTEGGKKVYNKPLLEGIIAHELFHFAFKHLPRAKLVDTDFGKDYFKKKLWNYLVDAFVNEMVFILYKEYKSALEAVGVITFKDIEELFKEIGMEMPKDAYPEELYRILLQHEDKIRPLLSDAFDLWHNEETDKLRDEQEQEGKIKVDEDSAKRMLKEVKKEIDNIKEENSGIVSSNLDIFLAGISSEGKAFRNLGSLLGRSIEAQIRKTKDYVQYRNKPSALYDIERFGAHPIIPNSKFVVEKGLFIVIIVDTSGSMFMDAVSLKSLLDAMGKTLGFYSSYVKRLTKGEEPRLGILLLEVDADIVNKTFFNSFRSFASALKQYEEGTRSLKGSGGTDMVPGLEFVANLKNKVDMVFVLTDGEMGNIEKLGELSRVIRNKHGVPVVFALTRNGDDRRLLSIADGESVILTRLGEPEDPASRFSRRFKP